MEEESRATGKLTRPETITSLVHYYRAEVTRSLAWRERLDRTTNWAVGSVAAFLGFAFSHPEIHHSLFFFALAIVYTLLFVEARRYRFFDAYEYRVRLMHQYFFYGLLTGTLDLAEDSYWVAELASDLRYPQYKVGFLYALGRRFKANYVYLFGILLAAWLLKIKVHPSTARSWFDYLDQAALGQIPGWVTLLFILLFVGHAAVLFYIGSKPLGGRDLLSSAPDKEKETRPEHG
ncbi:MAG TPA: DUF2270 domain-containing protein [Geobacteraceae bacterium]